MRFDVITYINCIIESVVLMLFWTMLLKGKFAFYRYGIMFLCLCGASVLVTSVENSVLFINFGLLFICGYLCFSQTGMYNAFLYTVFSFLSLVYLQAILMWLFPKNFIVSKTGNLAINGAVLLTVLFLTWLSKRFCWAEVYEKNKGTVWLFLILLCVPSIAIMQIVVTVLEKQNYLLIFSLLTLQLCYMLALLLMFLLYRRKQERRQIANIKQTIETLNLYMEDSKRRVHDFNKHILFLHSIVSTQSTQPELKAQVDTYCQDLLSISEQEEIMLQLDDPTLRALLYRRAIQAKSSDIPFLLNASAVLPSFPLRDYQLVTIFDNLLDNAFECLGELSCEKWINVSLQVVPLENGYSRHIFCVQNPFEELDFSSIVSQNNYTSKGETHQGIGLQNVAKLVSASGGKFILNNDDHIFTAKIVYEQK